MQNFMLAAHSILRWVLLILLLLSIVRAFAGWQNKRTFAPQDRRIFLYTLISTHLNFLIGLYLLFFGTFGVISGGLPQGVELMKSKFFRFYWVEHPVGMLVAIILITIGNGVGKKNLADALKFKKIFWYFAIALIIILATIPWPFRDVVGRPLLFNQ